MIQRLTVLSLSAVAVAAPSLASAATIGELITSVGVFMNTLIGIFIALAVVVFFWGLIRWLWSVGPDDAHKGLSLMFWGLIAIFVMVSIWGLIRVIRGSVGIDDTQNRAIDPPRVNL